MENDLLNVALAQYLHSLDKTQSDEYNWLKAEEIIKNFAKKKLVEREIQNHIIDQRRRDEEMEIRAEKERKRIANIKKKRGY